MGEGKQKRLPKKDLPPDVNWPDTCTRFCAEMAKFCFDQPTGGVTNPETAYARTAEFIKEDLHHSVSGFFYCDSDHHLTNPSIWRQPLVAGPLGKRPGRDMERYLTYILEELRPRKDGEKKGAQHVLERGKRTTHHHRGIISANHRSLQLRKNSKTSWSS